jgi:hypothetical protein
MSEVKASQRRAHEQRIAEVIDSAGLRVSETITADTFRLEPFGDGWVAKFEGAVWLTPEQMRKLIPSPAAETHVQGSER